MLIDNVIIKVKAGDGGKGAVAFNKNIMALGPVGGNGGDGGDVYFEGISDLSALSQFRNIKEVEADDGMDGRGDFADGVDGKDVIIKVPVGTVIHNLDTGKDVEIIHVGQREIIARGGWGGRGNFKFRGPTNTRPKEFEYGKPGQEFNIQLELKLIADVGLVGLPNSGKSSLLNELTGASSKVGNYAFTTLEPHLGVYYGVILADIPGLIEGASEGKGLGHKFLRHVERTKTIFHLVSAESENPAKDYKTVRKELEKYSKVLAKKKEHVFLSKHDILPEKEMKKKLAQLRKVKKTAQPLSIHDIDSLKKVQKLLGEISKKK